MAPGTLGKLCAGLRPQPSAMSGEKTRSSLPHYPCCPFARWGRRVGCDGPIRDALRLVLQSGPRTPFLARYQPRTILRPPDHAGRLPYGATSPSAAAMAAQQPPEQTEGPEGERIKQADEVNAGDVAGGLLSEEQFDGAMKEHQSHDYANQQQGRRGKGRQPGGEQWADDDFEEKDEGGYHGQGAGAEDPRCDGKDEYPGQGPFGEEQG